MQKFGSGPCVSKSGTDGGGVKSRIVLFTVIYRPSFSFRTSAMAAGTLVCCLRLPK